MERSNEIAECVPGEKKLVVHLILGAGQERLTTPWGFWFTSLSSFPALARAALWR